MVSINGNFGLFGNDGNKKVQKTEIQKQAEVKPNVNVPIGQQNGIQHTDAMGDKLLESANFYARMGLELNINKTQKPEAKAGSLDEMAQVLPTLTVASADNTDKKATYDAVQGKDWSSYLTRAYAYGNISEETMGFLNNSEQMDKLNELAGLA